MTLIHWIPFNLIFILLATGAGYFYASWLWCLAIALLGVSAYAKHKRATIHATMASIGKIRWFLSIYLTQFFIALGLYAIGYGLGWLYDAVMDWVSAG